MKPLNALEGVPRENAIFQGMTLQPAWHEANNFDFIANVLSEQISLDGMVLVKVDMRLPIIVPTRMDDAEREIWLMDLEEVGRNLLHSLPIESYLAEMVAIGSPHFLLHINSLGLQILMESDLISDVSPVQGYISQVEKDSSFGGQSVNGTAANGNVTASRIRKAKNPIPNQYIVTLRETALSKAPRKSSLRKAEVDILTHEIAGIYGASIHARWSLAITGMSVRMNAKDAERLSQDPRVEMIEEDAIVYGNEIQTPATWGLDRVNQRNLPLDATYNYSNKGAGVTAYIIDTGIRISHNEFGGRATWGGNFTSDGNNTDCHGHGTHVAGTVGGLTYGIAKEVDLIAVKVLNCLNQGTLTGILNGINWMIMNKKLPAVANMSLGSSFSSTLNTAIASAITEGISVVVAAGNDGFDACYKSPASAPNAITVGATTNLDTRATFSNYGACVDLFAPGSQITSAYSSSDTATNVFDGTSMASPHVAGAVALYLSDNPNATPTSVSTEIVANSTPGKVIYPGPRSPNQLLFTGFDDRASLVVTKTGFGHVTSYPSGIDCGQTCGMSYSQGDEIVLTATPDPGFTFSGWAGDCSGMDVCTLNVSGPQTVIANFQDINGSGERFPLGGNWPIGWSTPADSAAPWMVVTTPLTEGNYSLRSGAISDSQKSIIQLTDDFTAGVVYFEWTFSSQTSGDYIRFYIDDILKSNWSGCTAWVETCWMVYFNELPAGIHTLKWSYEKNTTGSYGQDAAWLDNVQLPSRAIQLNVSIDGDGVGTVLSDPPGIDCGSDCEEKYSSGTLVTLSATPAADATFAGWSGGGCSGTGTCQVTLTSAKSVTATFTLKTHTLKVTKSGTGKGTVTSSPAGISCGSVCAKAFPQGTLVSLSATPYTGSAFAGWSGACTGTGACQVTLDSAQSVAASFVPLTLRISDASLSEGHSGTQDLTFTLSLSGVSAGTVKVDYATANGSASAGSDYTTTKGSLSFAPGVTQQTLRVPVLGDTTLEANETLYVNLSRPSGASLADKQGLGLILNDDGPALSIADASLTEGHSGSQVLTFTLTLSAPSATEVKVIYATQDLTATAGSDYVATNGTLTFPPNTTSQTLAVAILGDTAAEPNEGFTLNLSRPSSNAYLADSQGLGLILNDDSPRLSINDVSRTEGDSGSQTLAFTVSLSAPSASVVTVRYATQDLTATAGSDYDAASGALSFDPGVTSQVINLNLHGDTVPEVDETFTLKLTRPANATLADDLGVGTIVNDD